MLGKGTGLEKFPKQENKQFSSSPCRISRIVLKHLQGKRLRNCLGGKISQKVLYMESSLRNSFKIQYS